MNSHLTKKKNNSEFVAQSPKSDDDKSVEDMLANVDQFIEGVYRDLSMSPPRRASMGNSTNLGRSVVGTSSSASTTTPAGHATLPITTPRRESSSPSTTPDGTDTLPITPTRRGGEPITSPAVRGNMAAEIERINQICDNVEQNLRSIGVFMNSSSPNSLAESLADTNLINSTSPSPASSMSIVIVNNTTPSISSMTRSTGQQRRTSVNTTAGSVIDLSNSQTETDEWFTPPHNDDEDDVILVSANIPPVVDLCTPSSGGHPEMYRPRHNTNRHLNRRRLHRDGVGNDVDDRPCEEASPPKRRWSSVNETASAAGREGRTPFMCPVCIESFLQRQPTSTVCGHVFCKLCIEKAVALTHKCPMCNKKITRKQTFRIYW